MHPAITHAGKRQLQHRTPPTVGGESFHVVTERHKNDRHHDPTPRQRCGSGSPRPTTAVVSHGFAQPLAVGAGPSSNRPSWPCPRRPPPPYHPPQSATAVSLTTARIPTDVSNMSDSMEVELLKQMMAERETRIELLQVKLTFYEEKQARLCSELEQVKDQRENEAIEQQGERVEWNHTHAESMKQLEQLTRDLHQQMASLQKYVGMVQQQQEKGGQQQVDSSFVMQMQAQLCKAMHSQGIADHQLRLAREHADSLVKQLREALVSLEEERSTVELEFMNALVREDTETRELENGFKDRLTEIQKEIAQLEEDTEDKSQASEGVDSETEEQDDDEEEEDAEELKAAKEELMGMLRELRDKIASTEKENASQLRKISSLKRRLENPGGSSEFLSPSEEMGMSYDDSESDDGSEDAEDLDDHAAVITNDEPEHGKSLSSEVSAETLSEPEDETAHDTGDDDPSVDG